MFKLLPACFAVAAVLIAGVSRATTSSTPAPPAWFLEHLEELMQAGGLSIADNADYQSPTEPAEAYGVEWRWGVGRMSLVGRLYAIVGGKSGDDIWQMRTFWHPVENRAVAVQYGGDGTYAEGWIKPTSDGGTEIEQTFFSPDGTQGRVRHENSPIVDGEHASASFRWVNEAWVANRQYAWLLAEDADEE